jgi:hypothetical protein
MLIAGPHAGIRVEKKTFLVLVANILVEVLCKSKLPVKLLKEREIYDQWHSFHALSLRVWSHLIQGHSIVLEK